MILIYNDDGVSAKSFNALSSVFSALKKPTHVVNAKTLQTMQWMQSAQMLVIPGGRSLPFYNSLGATGNRHIASFVSQGGAYLGLCAGAYYASRETIFAQGLPLELRLPGELNFFEGCAIGPVFLSEEFAYQSEAGATVVEIIDEDNHCYNAYFNGGCYFDGTETQSGCQVLARYAVNDKPALITCSVGAGRAILSGVHPELSPDSYDSQELLLKIIA